MRASRGLKWENKMYKLKRSVQNVAFKNVIPLFCSFIILLSLLCCFILLCEPPKNRRQPT